MEIIDRKRDERFLELLKGKTDKSQGDKEVFAKMVMP